MQTIPSESADMRASGPQQVGVPQGYRMTLQNKGPTPQPIQGLAGDSLGSIVMGATPPQAPPFTPRPPDRTEKTQPPHGAVDDGGHGTAPDPTARVPSSPGPLHPDTGAQLVPLEAALVGAGDFGHNLAG